MNGLISTAKTLYVSSCLFAGFALGIHPEVQIPKMLAGFHPQNVSISTLSWIVKSAEMPVSIQKETAPSVDEEPSPRIEEIKLAKTARHSPIKKRIKRGNLKQLEKLVVQLETHRPISAEDFEKAALSWSATFSTVLKKPDAVIAQKKAPLTAPRIELVRIPNPKPKPISVPLVQTVTKTQSSSVTEAEKTDKADSKEEQKWKDLLLSQQLASQIHKQVLAQNTAVTDRVRAPAPTIPEKQNLPAANPEKSPSALSYAARQNKPSRQVVSCKDLGSHLFERPLNRPSPGVSTQLCPEKLEWISKNWENEGWIQSTSPGLFKTVSRVNHQRPGKTLLFDDNAIADIALKGNLSVIEGSGLIIGSMPAGYKVEFLGHGEETIYFEINESKYFAILNAEPGSGVIEIHSTTQRQIASAFFAPVFANTVTYLELTEPAKRDIYVRVVKNDRENDPDVAGLIVAVSTQAQNQAITLSNGRAIIKGVYVQDRYPIFLDVTSKYKGEEGYRYRYEVNPLTRTEIRLSQMSDQTLHKWLKQVNSGISDQSAMVVGFFDRKKINGFSDHHFVQVKSLSGGYGFEPQTYSVLWNGKISATEPLEGDLPRFMSVQVPEGLGQTTLINDQGIERFIQLSPISPRVIHVIQE